MVGERRETFPMARVQRRWDWERLATEEGKSSLFFEKKSSSQVLFLEGGRS